MDICSVGINTIHKGDYIFERKNSGGLMLIFMRSSGIFSIKGTEKFAEQGTVIIIDGSEKICYKADREIFAYDWIIFDASSDSDFMESLEININSLIRHIESAYIMGLIRNIGSEFYSLSPRRGKNIETFMKMLLMKLGESRVCIRSNQQNTEPHYSELVELREKIYRNPQMKWSVDVMAAEVNMSRSYFQHIYRETFGVSCITDVISGKIEKAKELLSESAFSVSQVSAMCGYDNEEHFMRQFKKIVGVTPTKYRRK